MRSQGPNSIKGSLAIVSNALSTATCRSYSNHQNAQNKDLRIKPMSLEKVVTTMHSQPRSLDRTKPVWPLLSADHVPHPACKSIAESAKVEKILVLILPFHHWKVLWRYPACCQLCFLAGWLPVKGIQTKMGTGSEATKHSWNPSLGDQENALHKRKNATRGNFRAWRNPTALLAKS